MKKLIESFGTYRILNEAVSHSQLTALEKYLDTLFSELKIDIKFSRHFIERVNDKRNKDEPITIRHIRDVFRENFKKHKDELKNLHNKDDAHFLKVSERLDIPFTFVKKGNELEIVSKSIIRRGEKWAKTAKPSDGGNVLKVD